MNEIKTPCEECGMLCESGEFHTFGHCLMYKACHNEDTVYQNAMYLAMNHPLNTATAREARLVEAYNELIMAVSHKYEGETRHQTALKYIQRAEMPSGEACFNAEALAEHRGEQ